MNNQAIYDDNNIFAKIVRSEMPAYKIFENEKTLAFMDVMPRADGHCLVIPKAPSRNILDIAPNDLSETILVTQKVALAAKHAFKADGITLNQFSESAGGQVIFHTHFHIIPRFNNVDLKPHTGQMAKSELLEKHAGMIKKALDDLAQT